MGEEDKETSEYAGTQEGDFPPSVPSQGARVLAQGEEGDPPSVSLGEVVAPMMWTEGTWKGLARWQCALCPWDTLKGEEAMRAHIRQVHTRRVDLGLVDGSGRPLVRETIE